MWLGPHFVVDLVRLARKGWPNLVRVGYLGVLFVAIAFMYRTQTDPNRLMSPGQYAVLAQSYANTIIVVQNLLVLALMPVYVASAIAEEKENQTLEALTLTHLTDRELVLGKLAGRLMHVGAIALSSLPILAFMHLWGNVEVGLIIYHEANTFLLLVSAGSMCILISTMSESVFQAISYSYVGVAAMALFGIGGAFALPWAAGSVTFRTTAALGDPTADYWVALAPLLFGHGIFIVATLTIAVSQIERLRQDERRRPKKTTSALALADTPSTPEPEPGDRGQVRSRIHPWAWPVSGDPLWWKECLKDGTTASLSVRWFIISIAAIIAVAIPFRSLYAVAPETRDALMALMSSFTFTSYFLAVAAYGIVVVFQLTMSVAGEREQDTLTTLFLIPDSRRAILIAKWIGPWWRNWPILALSWLGIALGLGFGVTGITGAFILLLMPWPLLLLLGGGSLLLSVWCRRVLFANIAIVGFIGLLVLAHIAAGPQTNIVFGFYVAAIGESRIDEFVSNLTWAGAASHALAEQVVFLLAGVACVVAAFRKFQKGDYVGR